MEQQENNPVVAGAGQAEDNVPRWMPWTILVLVLAILAVIGALVYDVFTEESLPQTLAERDIVFYTERVAKDPADSAAHVDLARAYVKNGEHALAVAEAGKAIKLEPKNMDAFLVLGLAQRLQGSLDSALKTFDQVLALVPDSTEAHVQKAMALLAKGDQSEAEKELRAAVELTPTAADSRVELARLLEKRGLKAEAVAEYREALRYVPGYEPALDALARLGAR